MIRITNVKDSQKSKIRKERRGENMKRDYY